VRSSLVPLRNGLAGRIHRRRLAVATFAVVSATALFLLGNAPARADFHAVDGTLNVDDTRDAVDTSVADVGGVPYVAWRETTGILGGLIFVKRFDGTSWVQVGGSLNVDATKGAVLPSITSVAGVPYVTWQESDGAKFQIRVARFNGTTWEAVGPSLNTDTAQAGTEPSIASVGGVPYVAWAESIATVNREKIHVRRLNANGTTWDLVGTDLNFDATKQGLAPRIADVGGVPYVTWFEGVAGGQHQVYVRRLNSNGTTWDLVGTGSLNIDATKDAVRPDVASVGGVPYVAWHENDTFDLLHVKRFDGSDWVSVGGVLNVSPTKNVAFTPGIADVGGIPYVAWSETAVPTTQVVVRRFDGANWVSVGGTSNPDPTRAAFAPAMAVVGGFPYVAWTDTKGADGKTRVARQLPPTCAGTSVAVGHDTPATIPLSCLDAIGFAIANGPAHGTLSAINPLAATVTYTPNPGFGGADSFGFTATDGTFNSSVTTVALTVAGGPSGALAAVSRLRIGPRTFRAASRGASTTRVRRTGTDVSYRDTQAAITTFTVVQSRRGIRRGRRCVKARHGQRGRRCTRKVALGSFTHRDVVGANSFHFTGRVRRKKLKPGSYRLEAVPRIRGRNGHAISAGFRIVP
jgi:Bacterial Ig domain